MDLLPQVKQGYDAIMADKDIIVWGITGQMTFFPLCCSTGIIKNLGANVPDENHRASFEANEKIDNVSVEKIKNAKYIHEIIRECATASRPLFFPLEVARWNALSLCYVKATVGTDDGPSGGYANFKAAQIVMCDRIVADKRNPKFAFGGYNIVYSVDQFMDYLSSVDQGDFYGSPPVPGGHGARVRAGIFTPDHKAMKEYHDAKIEILRSYVLEVLGASTITGKVRQAVDKVAASW